MKRLAPAITACVLLLEACAIRPVDPPIARGHARRGVLVRRAGGAARPDRHLRHRRVVSAARRPGRGRVPQQPADLDRAARRGGRPAARRGAQDHRPVTRIQASRARGGRAAPHSRKVHRRKGGNKNESPPITSETAPKLLPDPVWRGVGTRQRRMGHLKWQFAILLTGVKRTSPRATQPGRGRAGHLRTSAMCSQPTADVAAVDNATPESASGLARRRHPD